jgi:Protein of unknown function (DUF3592)
VARKLSPKTEAARASTMRLGRVMMVAAAVIVAIAGNAALRGAMTLTWPRVTAEITSAELALQVTRTSGRGNIRPHDEVMRTFHVVYHYRVGDQDYVAGGLEPYDFGLQNSAGAGAMSERHPVGEIVEVAYDPDDPSVAYLEPGPSSASLMLTALGAVIGLIGLRVYQLGRGPKPKRRSPAPPRDKAKPSLPSAGE